ncbi:AsmA family protein [Candidatus Thiosymbion oneisti]|uniref:AsmA family protein n=1 Tax=Candidatus Thiosymbion oneisti TaxID=589554 RepID=UPI00105F5607|nr:AsmA family protein [Candidatus Thiosymbion oneisti]
MNKLLKFLAVLLLLSVATLVVAAYAVDLNAYKDDIRTEFTAATGHELVIAGDLRVALFPKPVLEIRQASVPGALDGLPALAEIDLVRLYPRWAPLLAGRLELARVRVEGLRLHLIRDGQGRANWDAGQVPPVPRGAGRTLGPWSLAGPSRSPGPFDAWAAEADPATDWPPIGQVELSDAQVTWDDRRSGQRLEFDSLEARARPVAPDRPVAWRVTGSMRTGGEGRPAAVHAEGNLRIGDGSQPIRLEPLLMRLEGFGLDRDLAADFLLRTGVDADLDTGHYLADQVALEVRIFGAALSEGRVEARVNAGLDLDLSTERLQVTELAIRSGALSASGRLLGQTLLSTPVFTGDLRVDAFDLRAWLTHQGLPLPRTADPETFRRCSLDARWHLENGRLGVSDLVLGVDETKLTGEIEQVSTSPLGSRFDLVADRLDLDAYLPPSEQTSAQPGQVSQQRAPVDESTATPAGPDTGKATAAVAPVSGQPPAVSAPMPGAANPGAKDQQPPLPSAPTPGPASAPAIAGPIGNLDLEGRLRIGELELARLRFGDTDLEIRAKDGSLEVANRVQRFCEGSLAGRLALDIRGTEPRVALVQRAEEVESGRLLADLPWGDRVSGRGEITADLAATGRSADALRRSLAGTLAIRFPHGVIKGVNLERLIREANARLSGAAAPEDLPMQTEFTDLRASAEVRNGVLSNRDLVATADHLRITGAGTLDLVQGRIDYRFEPMFVKPPQGRGIKELEGIPIPVHLTGSFDYPRWDLDLGSVLGTAAKRRLGEQGEELFQSLEERTGIKGLGQGLKSLFGR